jgi:ribosomal protein S18 acetylase RimI-like enzyme
MSDVTIRTVQQEELAKVLELWEEAGVTSPSSTDSLEGLRRLTEWHGAVLLVAIIDDRIVGSVIGGWDGWRGNIYRLAVGPKYRRRNIARRLVTAISGALFDKGAHRLSALVEHEHPWAIGFWNSLQDLGYAPDPKFARYIADRRLGGKLSGGK